MHKWPIIKSSFDDRAIDDESVQSIRFILKLDDVENKNHTLREQRKKWMLKNKPHKINKMMIKPSYARDLLKRRRVKEMEKERTRAHKREKGSEWHEEFQSVWTAMLIVYVYLLKNFVRFIRICKISGSFIDDAKFSAHRFTKKSEESKKNVDEHTHTHSRTVSNDLVTNNVLSFGPPAT